MIKNERSQRTILPFKQLIKTRLLVLNYFQFSRIEDFDLKKNFRFQYVLENFLQYEVGEATLKKYVDFLMTKHSIMVMNIASHRSNFELLVKNLYREHYLYMEVLIEILESVKFDLHALRKVQTYLNEAGLAKFILSTYQKFEFEIVNSKLELRHKEHYFRKNDHLAAFFQTFVVFCSNNPDGLKDIFYDSSKPQCNILNILFATSFQTNIPSIWPFAIQIQKVLLETLKASPSSLEDHRPTYINTLINFFKDNRIKTNSQFLRYFDMLTSFLEPSLVLQIIDNLGLVDQLISCVNSKKHKQTSLLIAKIFSVINSRSPEYFDDNIRACLKNRIIRLGMAERNNMLLGRFAWLFTQE